MNSIAGKKILLGVTGSIAAYKAALLVRLLRKEGAEVQVIATAAALEFVTPLTLATLSGRPVLSAFVKGPTGEWNNHVEWGLWADLIVIAPASANTLAKMANGLCDSLLMATYLSARCPVMLAPAMDLDMYVHPATLDNIRRLTGYGHIILDSPHGELASGLTGKGRMAEPEDILSAIRSHFDPPSRLLEGVKVLITAGSTHEFIDPVRYITNGSTGKMGYALADRAAELGADVTVVSGPATATLRHQNIRLLVVQTAAQMYQVALEWHADAQICVFAAAVADYTPIEPATEKIKKQSDELHLVLRKTTDIAAELGKRKKTGQYHVGFALETEQELVHATGKLHRKNFDVVVLNSLRDTGAGFGHDTNKVTLVSHTGIEELPLMAKREVAAAIWDKVGQNWKK